MSMERRRPLVAANWKMNLLKADAADFCRDLKRGLAAPPTPPAPPGETSASAYAASIRSRWRTACSAKPPR